MKDFSSKQILPLHTHVFFWSLNEICIYQLAHRSYTKVSERLKVDKIIIYIRVKPIMPEGVHMFLQITVLSRL